MFKKKGSALYPLVDLKSCLSEIDLPCFYCQDIARRGNLPDDTVDG